MTIKKKIVRCQRIATDNHHALRRSQGGTLLDEIGETYHMLALCHECHMAAHAGHYPYLFLDGSVQRDKVNDRLIYTGTDEYLKGKYGEEVAQEDAS